MPVVICKLFFIQQTRSREQKKNLMIVQDIFLLRDTSGTVSFFVLDNSNRMNYILISIPFFTEQSTLLIHGW